MKEKLPLIHNAELKKRKLPGDKRAPAGGETENGIRGKAWGSKDILKRPIDLLLAFGEPTKLWQAPLSGVQNL